ncbi:16207_t:CDS:2 [Acaulospora morrowiae]|uniref:16207_t:CDS:1 n=1 Tax=Acaulospora morrowiae TaxID=94023 RepID=A0A9N9CTU4_9GLOM|nr:16207_t:CDS:2 [Acaulospora morrowiae]
MKFFSKLLDPIPQYVTCCLPALAIMGESPAESFRKKLLRILICLGCPFTGLFYSLIIGGTPENRCLYWLSSDKIKLVSKENTEPDEPDESGNHKEFPEPYRPFVFHACEIDKDSEPYIEQLAKQCTAKASVLERLSAIGPIYFIIIGMLALISQAQGTINCKDWPHIPFLLSWILPATFIRVYYGIIFIKDPDMVQEKPILISKNKGLRRNNSCAVFAIAFFSIFYPWITLFLVYLSPPIGTFDTDVFKSGLLFADL